MTSPKPSLDPSIIVIFGITGDLSQRYLLPALYHLIKDGLLHEQTEIVGISRSDISAANLLDNTQLCDESDGTACDPEALQKMRDHTRMVQMDVTNQADYAALLDTLNGIEDAAGMCMNRLYYLSIPPQVYGPIIAMMGSEGLNASCQHGKAMTRLLVEKPFGYDTASAQALIDETGQVFGEEQIFRIDHYLAKETVQNILTFRFQNPIFESIWDARHVSSIEISASEKIGIEGRAQFYEPLGALRDFIQSHLLQILAIVTMDQPASMASDAIHQAKQQLLHAVQTVPADRVNERAVRAQYDTYRQEADRPHSSTETFAGIQVYINSERWRDVPVTLWTGKALAERKAEITVTFSQGKATNKLRFQIQPDEGIALELAVKKPGFDDETQTTVMDFSYQQSFGGHSHPDAYERVLVDAVRGDHTLFATGDEVMQAWRIVQPVLDNWAGQPQDIQLYDSGTAGAALAEPLF